MNYIVCSRLLSSFLFTALLVFSTTSMAAKPFCASDEPRNESVKASSEIRKTIDALDNAASVNGLKPMIGLVCAVLELDGVQAISRSPINRSSIAKSLTCYLAQFSASHSEGRI